MKNENMSAFYWDHQAKASKKAEKFGSTKLKYWFMLKLCQNNMNNSHIKF